MKYLKHIILILILIALDFFTKLFFKNKNIYSGNTGIAFGLFQNNNLLFIILTLIVILVILYLYKEKEFHFGLDFILAGAIGNLISRIIYGFVIDFIDIKIWPSFNFADIFIVIGILMIFYKYFQSRKDYK